MNKHNSTIGLSVIAEMDKIVSTEAHLQMFGKSNVAPEKINKTASVKIDFHQEVQQIIEKLKKSSELMDSLGLEKTSSSVLEVLNEIINELSIKKMAEMDESDDLKEEIKRYKKEHPDISPEELDDELDDELESLYQSISHKEQPDLEDTEICPDCGFDHMYEKHMADDWHKQFGIDAKKIKDVEFLPEEFDKELDFDANDVEDSNDISENLFNAMMRLDPKLVPSRNKNVRQMLQISPLGYELDEEPTELGDFLGEINTDEFLNPYLMEDSDTPLPRPSSINTLKDKEEYLEINPEEIHTRTHETVRPSKKKSDTYLRDWLKKHGEKVEDEEEEDFEDEDEDE